MNQATNTNAHPILATLWQRLHDWCELAELERLEELGR